MTNATKTQRSNKPETLRDGSLKAVLWRNEGGEKGPRYSVELVRSYKDPASGSWRDVSSFSNGELLRIARLAERAYDRLLELRAEASEAAPQEE